MQLSRREKIVIIGSVGILGLLLVLQFVVRPVRERIVTLRRVVTDKRDILGQLRQKSLDYQRLEAQANQLRSLIGPQQEGRRILSSLSRIRQASGVPENMLSLKPTTTAIDNRYQETVVEVRLDGVTYAHLVAFLRELEALDLAGGVKTLEVQHADRNPGLLRAVIQLSTVTRLGPT
ncbi:MAG: type II secretion system protein GspM [Planctomycetes bacterium]|jgi:type II secretory pathway component PulM|nr:type II secretion system protein GspM [Planctomycetota bacterium]